MSMWGERMECLICHSLPSSPRCPHRPKGKAGQALWALVAPGKVRGQSLPTGPSWETVCILKESSWPGFCSSSRRLEKALAIILLFLMRLGSSSLCPVNLRAEGVGDGKWRSSHFHRIL